MAIDKVMLRTLFIWVENINEVYNTPRQVTIQMKTGCIVDGTGSCACGVAVRVGKHVLTLSRCHMSGGIHPLKVTYYDNGCSDIPMGLELHEVQGLYMVSHTHICLSESN